MLLCNAIIVQLHTPIAIGTNLSKAWLVFGSATPILIVRHVMYIELS